MKPLPPSLSDEVRHWLCETRLIRPAVVAACRARVAANDWPPPIEVADAVLAGWARPQLVLERPADRSAGRAVPAGHPRHGLA